MPTAGPVSRSKSRTFQAIALIALAVAQIVSAQLTDLLHIGQNVALRSAAVSHPLVPWGYAFAIWGVIYIWSLVSAFWQIGAKHNDDPALKAVGWNMAGMFLLNCVWQIWVPLRGLDWASFAIVGLSVILGLSGLLRLREMRPQNGDKTSGLLSRADTGFVFAPMALMTGWLTAAAFVDFTSVLVGVHSRIDPSDVNVSTIFLIVLLVFGVLMIWLTRSLSYSLALMWAVFWIMMANIYRDHEFTMATVAMAGMFVIAVICVWTMYERRPRGGGRHLHA